MSAAPTRLEPTVLMSEPPSFPEPAPSRRRPVAWAVFLALGALATLVYYLLPQGVVLDVWYEVMGAAAVVAIVVGARRHADRPLPWFLLAAGEAMFVAGDVLWSIYDRVLHLSPFPSAADGFYLAGYPLIAAALLVMVRRRTEGRDRATLIDAGIVSIGIGLVSWVFLMEPYANDPSLTITERVFSLAYPLGDVLVLVLAARLLLGPGLRRPAFRLLAASLVALLVSDLVFAYEALRSGYAPGESWSDALYLLTYTLVATTALHPSMRSLSDPEQMVLPTDRLTRRRLLVLTLASLVAPAVLAYQYARGDDMDVPLVVVGSTALFVLVVTRMAGLVRRVEAHAGDLDERGRQLRAALGRLQQAQAERGRLLDRTVRAAEEERVRVAAELHDGPIQGLAALTYRLERARRRIQRNQADEAETILESLQRHLADEIGGLRRLMSDLRPPVLDERGIGPALQDLVELQCARNGLDGAVDVNVDGPVDPSLEVVLYRVAQEALLNAAKHAQATRVWIRCRSGDRGVELEVGDDGRGFDPGRAEDFVRSGHFGLAGMRERVELAGGRWTMASGEGRGTVVRARFAARRLVEAG
jgi:signal transduction histidine kinase